MGRGVGEVSNQHLAVRTVRDGRVKIKGQWFVPRDRYDGELDGQRFAFGLYWSGDRMQPFVSLWGPEQNYRERDNEKWERSPCEKEDGMYWTWWNAAQTDRPGEGGR